ncbi:MAG: hypothetical protein KC621_23595, partial [Myxococcales bacterium]|nr:hypothetical protein [Myxococcales bacterium]
MDGARRTTALVLGGGGALGNAWLIGVLAGLADGGLDVTDADRLVGTSAGATAVAQICGASLTDLYAQALAPVPPRQAGVTPRQAGGLMERTQAAFDAASDPGDLRRRLAASAMEL